MNDKTLAVQRMQDYMESHLSENITLADLAAAAQFSPWYAARIFKELTGLAPGEYLRRLRLSKSALRLRDEQVRVIDVAADLGFESVDGYQRAFRREFGCNPKEYALRPVPLPLFTAYGVKFRELWKKERNRMANEKSVFIQVMEKPQRKVVVKRGVQAADYWSYCQEVGCDVWGVLTSMPSLCGEPVCLWLPVLYRGGKSEYVQGVEVSADYADRNVTTTSTLTVKSGTTLRLCLNGHYLFGGVLDVSNGDFPIITVESGGTLDLCNCQNGKYPDNGNVSGVCGILTEGTTTMYGGTVSGNSAMEITQSNNGGGVSVKGGSFTLYDGAIDQNAAHHGGGVYVASGASFSILGRLVSTSNGSAYYTPTLEYNQADGDGGGVYVAPGGTFSMDGGIIGGNQAGGNGGGIYAGDSFSLGGKVRIAYNSCTADSVFSNVYLCPDKTITVSGELSVDAPIGVTTSKVPAENFPVDITAPGSTDASASFTGDDMGYRTKNSGTGGAQVVQLTLQEPFLRNNRTGITYNALQKAFDEAADGDIITLLEDFNSGLNTVVLNDTRALTFDLNGNALTCLSYAFSLTDGASLTVSDSSTPGGGTIACPYAAVAAFRQTKGTLILTGGTVTMGNWLYLGQGHTLDLRGGTISLSADCWYAVINSGGTVRVSGGSIEGYTSPADLPMSYAVINNTGSFTMSGGSISAKTGVAIGNRTARVISGGQLTTSMGQVSVSGGNISSEGPAAIYSEGSGLIHLSQANASVPTVISTSGGPEDFVPSATILIVPKGAGSSRVLWVEGGALQNTYDGSQPHYAVYVSKTVLWSGDNLPATDLGVKILSPAATYLGAIWPENSSSGDSSSGGGSAPTTRPTEPVSGSAQNQAMVDETGKAIATVTNQNIADALADAKAAASKKGVNAGDITAVIHVTAPSGSHPDTVSVNLPKTVQQQVINQKIAHLSIVINQPDVSIGMDLAAMTELYDQAGGDVQLSVTRANANTLSAQAKAAIGSRPAFDLSATYANGSQHITHFGTGSIRVELPYVLAPDETAGNIRGVYITPNGAAICLANSSYDAKRQVLALGTNHLSVYGVGYWSVEDFADISGHWAKDDILFVAGRGLLNGTGITAFSPNQGMTRGMFVTALWRLAEAPQAGERPAFTDVSPTAYYADAVAWANENSIVAGIRGDTFAPSALVTREQMAVILQRYAADIGFPLPQVKEQISFADDAQISGFAADAVQSMQMAGILTGKSGNVFDPQGTVTRAEASAVLRRFVELFNSQSAAQG